MVGISEIDKYAIDAYNALHPGVTNYGDISKINWDEVPDFDLFTYSSPCQDFSSAGLQRGGQIKDGCMIDTYNQQIQYDVSCTIRTNINTANHHFIAIMEEYNKEGCIQVGNIYPDSENMENTLTTSCNQGVVIGAAKVQQVGTTKETEWNKQQYRVYSIDGLSPCLNCCGGGGLEPKIVEQDMTTIIGNKQKNPFRGTTEEISPCITSACGAGGGMTPMFTDAPLEYARTEEFIEQLRGHQEPRYRIRKLTPRECLRLMDVSDSDIDKIQAVGISNSQQYKLAGNSIVVDVLYHLFRKMFVETENESQQLTLF